MKMSILPRMIASSLQTIWSKKMEIWLRPPVGWSVPLWRRHGKMKDHLVPSWWSRKSEATVFSDQFRFISSTQSPCSKIPGSLSIPIWFGKKIQYSSYLPEFGLVRIVSQADRLEKKTRNCSPKKDDSKNSMWRLSGGAESPRLIANWTTESFSLCSIVSTAHPAWMSRSGWPPTNDRESPTSGSSLSWKVGVLDLSSIFQNSRVFVALKTPPFWSWHLDSASAGYRVQITLVSPLSQRDDHRGTQIRSSSPERSQVLASRTSQVDPKSLLFWVHHSWTRTPLPRHPSNF